MGVPVADGLFRIDDDGTLTLLGGRSASSGLLHFPLAPVCPYTGADDVHAVDLPRSGRLWGWTEVTTAAPSYPGPVPYGLGVVELDTGDDPVLRVVGRIIDCPPADLTFGRAMLVVGEQLAGAERDGHDHGEDDGVIWAFRPASESDG